MSKLTRSLIVSTAIFAILALLGFSLFWQKSNEFDDLQSENENIIKQEDSVGLSGYPTYPELLAAQVDYSSVKSLASTLSFPLIGEGKKAYPTAFTGGGAIDENLASKQYRKAKLRARRIAINYGNRFPPSAERHFADCGAFVATVIINTTDPNFPGRFVYRQREYVQQPSNGWVKIGSSGNLDGIDLQPGDVFITSAEIRSGHTWIWLGDIDDKENVVAVASWGSDESFGAHLPALRTDPLHGQSADRRGREYDVWRFVGRE